MGVSAALLQKEIYSHNPMMKGMTNYFPCTGTYCQNQGRASGRKEAWRRRKRQESVCVYTHSLLSRQKQPVILHKLPNAELLMA